MEAEDQVVVGDADPPGLRQNGRGAWGLAAGALLLVAVLAAIVGATADDGTGPGAVALEAPAEPITTPSLDSADVPTAGWTPLHLREDGYVTSISYGPAGWLVITAGRGVQVHTSPDGAEWSSQRLSTGSATVMAPSAVAGERLVVAGRDVLTGRVRSWVSVDAGATWETIPLPDDHASPASVIEVNGDIFLTGAIFPPTISEPEVDAGTAAVWRLDDSAWRRLTFSEPEHPGSAVATMVERDGSTVAVGSDSRGLVVWQVDADRLTRIPVTGGGGARPDAVTRIPGGPYIAALTGGATSLASWDLFEWSTVDSPERQARIVAGDATVDIGPAQLEALSEGRVVVASAVSGPEPAGVVWIYGIVESPAVTEAAWPPP